MVQRIIPKPKRFAPKINNSIHLFFYLEQYSPCWRLSFSFLRLVLIRLYFFNQQFLFFYGHKLAENIKLTIIGYIRSQKVIVSPG